VSLTPLVSSLRAEAARRNERRLLVLAGDRDAGIDLAYSVIDVAGVDDDQVSFVTTREGFRYERLAPNRAARLLGATREIVVFDCHEDFSANTLGQLTGVVDGGGLLVLLTPPIASFPTEFSALTDQVLVPPFSAEAVGTHFRERLAETIRTHPGVAIVTLSESSPTATTDFGSDLATGSQYTIVRDGLTGSQSTPAFADSPIRTDRWASTPFPAETYEACLTRDQASAVAQFSKLTTPGHAIVVEADRGRGKSSAAGLAAGALAAAGNDVLVTAPAFDNAAELFERAAELLETLGRLDDASDETSPDRTLVSTTGGRLRFRVPPEAAAMSTEPDFLIVDEAATLSVRLLAELLAAPTVAFCTTVHGYEGTGRGFAVRFRDRLAASAHAVTDVTLEEPIRYARGDTVESWLFRTLLLDAQPPVSSLVADATPESVRYRQYSAGELAENESLLRSVFGLLVEAHYKTEPTDLVRLLEAPNLRVRALTHEGHVVSVALLAREGGLDSDTRAAMYRGSRVRGNMLPDVLTSQLRDADAAAPVGYRVMRIATHHAARSRGLGSALLSRCHEEFAGAVDWFGVGYGATPRLLDFWRANGYRTVHLSTTRNAVSGEHSALMLSPCSKVGADLATRHVGWFRDRIGDVLADSLSGLDADVVRGALRAAHSADHGTHLEDDVTDRQWRILAGVAYGPGTYEAAPGVFRALTLAHLMSPTAESSSRSGSGELSSRSGELSPRQERLAVRKVLQGEPWESIADDLEFVSTSQCMREMGTIARQFCVAFGGDVVADERERYDE